MKWKKFRLKTREEAEDIILASLADLGISGAEIEDKAPLSEEDKKQMFVDIMPDAPEDDGIAYLNFYLDMDEDAEALLAAVREELESLRAFLDIGEASIEESETEDKDWINNWKQYFRQFYVDDILVIPSWEEVRAEDKDRLILHIDPGTAFGTGMHETTQLCIRALKKFVRPGDRILDVGTGSGILAITGLKLGAGYAFGTDLDPCAEAAVRDNKKNNGIAEADFDLVIGNITDEREVQDAAGYEKYNIVTANILADILVPITPAILPHMKHGALYITSGIIEGQEWKVREAMEGAGLILEEVNRQGEWFSLVGRRP